MDTVGGSVITASSRGHKIYYSKPVWRYTDTNTMVSGRRKCKRCKNPPTSKGYDACLGYLHNVKAACCGHGVENGYIINN